MALMHYVKDVNILIELEHQNKWKFFFSCIPLLIITAHKILKGNE